MMKKTLLLTVLLLSLIVPVGVSAYTVYVSVDGSLDFTRIDKFQFDTSVPVALGDLSAYTVLALLPVDYNGSFSQGALPTPPGTWSIGVLTGPPPGANGIDMQFGANNLTQGVALSITKPDAFTLDNFILQEFGISSPGFYSDYPLPFTVTENAVTGGVEYIYTAVPIPGSLLLLALGLLCMAGLRKNELTGCAGEIDEMPLSTERRNMVQPMLENMCRTTAPIPSEHIGTKAEVTPQRHSIPE